MTDYPLSGEQKAKYAEILEIVKSPRDAARLHMKWMILTDLFFLGYEVLGLKNAKDRLGRKLVDPIFHRWMAGVYQRAMENGIDLLFMVARHHMKTTWLKVLVIMMILRQPLIRIGLFSSTASLVEAELKSIKRYFQTPILQELFPDQVPPPGKMDRNWKVSNANMLTLWRPEAGTGLQENQIEVYGEGANITGRHFDIDIFDDLIVSDDVATNSTARLERKRQWYAYAQGVLETYGQEIMVGTPYHYADLYANVQSEGIYEEVIKRPAIEDGIPVYSYFTLKRLQQLKKRMGDYIFEAQYMLNVLPREDQMFPPPQPTYHELPKADFKCYIAVDPAATTRTYSDETAIVVAFVDQHGHIWIEEARALKRTSEQIAAVLLDLNEKYKPLRIGIEFGLQEALHSVIRLVQAHYEESQMRKINLPIVGVPIKQVDKYKRINYTVGAFVRQGKLSVKDNLTDLMSQMEKINPNYKGKDDLVDAMSLLFPTIQNFPYRSGYNVNLHGIKDWGTWEDVFGRKKVDALEFDMRFLS